MRNLISLILLVILPGMIISCQEINRPVKEGQKIHIGNSKEIYTLKSFIGSDGQQYSTLEEARMESDSDDKLIIVKINETGGYAILSDCNLAVGQKINDQKTLDKEDYEANRFVTLKFWALLQERNYEGINAFFLEKVNETKFSELNSELDNYDNLSWKIIRREVRDGMVDYLLYCVEPMFYGDSEKKPFVEIKVLIDNAMSNAQFTAFKIKYRDEVDLIGYDQTGIYPHTLSKSELFLIRSRTLMTVLDSLNQGANKDLKVSMIEEAKYFKNCIENESLIDFKRMERYIQTYSKSENTYMRLRLMSFYYNHTISSRLSPLYRDIPFYFLDDILLSIDENLHYFSVENYNESESRGNCEIINKQKVNPRRLDKIKRYVAEAILTEAISELMKLDTPEKLQSEIEFLCSAEKWFREFSADRENALIYSEYFSSISFMILELINEIEEG